MIVKCINVPARRLLSLMAVAALMAAPAAWPTSSVFPLTAAASAPPASLQSRIQLSPGTLAPMRSPISVETFRIRMSVFPERLRGCIRRCRM